ncbi:MAG: exo-alpha-sialidase [Candidatus Latescibacteria bacterium]|nr:exo-alpha-sialidase [Candidatus Latescibacterota bacterium]
MHLDRIDRPIPTEHGVVSAFPGDFYGYFGWPTLARMDDGMLIAAASGLRNAHVCPFGRNVVCFSHDEGRTWTAPRVVNDSPLDDRDTGALSLGGGKLLLSWFTTDNRRQLDGLDDAVARSWAPGVAGVTDAVAAAWVGAWTCSSDDAGQTWNKPVKAPLTTPHGPIRLSSGDLLFFGKEFLVDMEGFRGGQGAIGAAKSPDGGTTWERLGKVPLYPGSPEGAYHEPHVAELPGGRLLGLIRLSGAQEELGRLGLTNFSLLQTVSDDGGHTWTPAEPLGFHGSPPHLLVHSSGALVCVYGSRLKPYGQRLMVSQDGGDSWTYDYILRADGPDSDLGYPSTVELGDGSLLSLYYQKPDSVRDKCALLWTRWALPA